MDYTHISLYLALLAPLQAEPDPPKYYYLDNVNLSVQQQGWNSFNCTDIKEILVMGRPMRFVCVGAIDGTRQNTAMDAYIKMEDGWIPLEGGMWSDRRWQLTLADCVYRGFLNITEEFNIPLADPHRRDLRSEWPGFFITFDYMLLNMSPEPTCEPTTVKYPTTPAAQLTTTLLPPNGQTCPPCPTCSTCSGTTVEPASPQSTTTDEDGGDETTTPSSSETSPPPTTSSRPEATVTLPTKRPTTSAPSSCPKNHDCGPLIQTAAILFPAETFCIIVYFLARNYKQAYNFARNSLSRSKSFQSDLESGSGGVASVSAEIPHLGAPYLSTTQNSTPRIPRANLNIAQLEQDLQRRQRERTQTRNTESGILNFGHRPAEDRPRADTRRSFDTESVGSKESYETEESLPETETSGDSLRYPTDRQETAEEDGMPDEEENSWEEGREAPGPSLSQPSEILTAEEDSRTHTSIFENIGPEWDELPETDGQMETGSTRPGESTASDETLASLELPLDFLVSGEGRTAAGDIFRNDVDPVDTLKRLREQLAEQRPRDNSQCSSLEMILDVKTKAGRDCMAKLASAKDGDLVRVFEEQMRILREMEHGPGASENKEHPASERGEEEVRDSSSSSLSQKTEYEPTPSTSRTSTEAQNTSLLEENPYVGVDGTVHGRSAPEADASDNGDDGRNWDSVLTNIRRIENNRYAMFGGKKMT